MKTKEAIELVDCNFAKLLSANECKSIATLLKRGEKFEKMWKNLKWVFKIPIASINGKFVLKGIKKLEQKYLKEK